MVGPYNGSEGVLGSGGGQDPDVPPLRALISPIVMDCLFKSAVDPVWTLPHLGIKVKAETTVRL